jgi:hypothetical protein
VQPAKLHEIDQAQREKDRVADDDQRFEDQEASRGNIGVVKIQER